MKVIKVNRKDVGDSAFPMCRKLISEGVPEDYSLEVWGDKNEYDYRIKNIGEGAKLRVSDDTIRTYGNKGGSSLTGEFK